MSAGHGKDGVLERIAGPIVEATGLRQARINQVVRIGEERLSGEIIRLQGGRSTIQVYEMTSGLRVGEPVALTGTPLAVELGPGLLGEVYDGLQRPLRRLAQESGNFIERGSAPGAFRAEKQWDVKAVVQPGDTVRTGDVIARSQETSAIEHLVMVPPGVGGTVVEVSEGNLAAYDELVVLEDEFGERRSISLTQHWPVREARPVYRRLDPRELLVTGTRAIDAFYPVATGGTAVIPGGFGTGKTVTEQTLAKFADVDVVVYVGCGERGNEMAEVLEDFPEMEDPWTGLSIMDRTVLIVNTSNMPVAAREASIYTGLTVAEYYRDMGLDVLLLTDSTSRWGEALREISGLLEEMPAEEGYPAYLAGRLSQFYERAGRMRCLPGGGEDGDEVRIGSVTIVGAVSPPGGDFSEPITQNSLRLTGTFWALETDLARRRHFPAISWTESYSLYDFTDCYAENLPADWPDLRRRAMQLLERESELQEIVELVGPESLSANQQLILLVARSLREDYLQQSAFDEVDRFCPIQKTYWMLNLILAFYDRALHAVEQGVSINSIRESVALLLLAEMKHMPNKDIEEHFSELRGELIAHVQTAGGG